MKSLRDSFPNFNNKERAIFFSSISLTKKIIVEEKFCDFDAIVLEAITEITPILKTSAQKETLVIILATIMKYAAEVEEKQNLLKELEGVLSIIDRDLSSDKMQ